MGQYYRCINLTKGEYVNPYSGLKLMEHAWIGNNMTTHVSNLLMNEWFGDRVIWCGDYTDNKAFSQYKRRPLITEYGVENIYSYAERMFKCLNKGGNKYNQWLPKHTKMKLKAKPEVFVNLTQRQYMLFNETPILMEYFRKTNSVSNPYEYINTRNMDTETLELLVNNDKSIKGYPNIIYAPALLLATSNGMGGGDYHGKDEKMCGRWVDKDLKVGERVGICTSLEECYEKIPHFQTFHKISPQFIEV